MAAMRNVYLVPGIGAGNGKFIMETDPTYI
jgi:hypothetical protein